MKMSSIELDYETIEARLRANYRAVTPGYRRDDEIEVTTEHHRRVGSIIGRLCNSFPHRVRVLDLGCGTGRYFHCVRNARELIGVDISDEMLRAAQDPVRKHQISVPEIRLRKANAYRVQFPPESFHVIYSLGMFGNGCPVTTELCDRLHGWLVPGGKLFFNTVDVAGLPLAQRARRHARGMIYPLLSHRLQHKLDERESHLPFFGMTRGALEDVLAESKFNRFEVKSQVCDSPLWTGRHLECVAVRK